MSVEREPEPEITTEQVRAHLKKTCDAIPLSGVNSPRVTPGNGAIVVSGVDTPVNGAVIPSIDTPAAGVVVPAAPAATHDNGESPEVLSERVRATLRAAIQSAERNIQQAQRAAQTPKSGKYKLLKKRGSTS